MSGEHATSEHYDPCGEFGPTQRWATIWFFAVIAIAVGAIYTLRNTDYYNYRTNGEFFNYDSYRQNRFGQNGIRSDSLDARADGRYGRAAADSK